MFCTGNDLHWLNAKGILGCIRQSRSVEVILALCSALLRYIWGSGSSSFSLVKRCAHTGGCLVKDHEDEEGSGVSLI